MMHPPFFYGATLMTLILGKGPESRKPQGEGRNFRPSRASTPGAKRFESLDSE